MAVLTVPGWLTWGRRATRSQREREAPVRVGRRRGASMGTRRRDEPQTALLPPLRRTLLLALRAMGVGLVLALMLALMGWVAQRPMFQIQRAVVSGDLRQVDRDLVAKRAQALRGNFFTVNLDAAAAELRAIPWVRAVNMRRLWPNGLEVEVEEQHPLAHWGDEQLLNTWGEVFVADYADALPRFDGPAGSGPEMARAAQQFNRELAPIGRQVEALDLSERRAWTLRLDNGLTLSLGRDNIHERLTRFVGVYPLVFKDEPARGALVDLRYPGGFALRSAGARG